MKLKGWQLIVFLGFALTALSAAAAGPTADDIYQAARAGHLSEAQRMVDQVVAEHPKSAKAHYVAAEIYAKEGQLGIARNELQTAEQLQPGLPFAKPQAVAELKGILAAPAATAATTAPAQQPVRQGSFPFGALVIGLLAIGVIVVIIKAMAARTANQTYYPAGSGQGYPGNGAAGYPAGGYPAAGGGGGLGSSIVGGLATGAAVGAGIVAGEALAHHFLDGDNTQAAQAGGVSAQPANYVQNDDMGGTDFGLNDASSWGDDSTFADAGGGDDWT